MRTVLSPMFDPDYDLIPGGTGDPGVGRAQWGQGMNATWVQQWFDSYGGCVLVLVVHARKQTKREARVGGWWVGEAAEVVAVAWRRVRWLVGGGCRVCWCVVAMWLCVLVRA